VTAAARSALEGAAALAAIALAVAWLSGACGERIAPEDLPPAPAADVPEGRLATVRAERAPAFESAAGTIESARHTTVSAEILARIEEVRAAAGAQVRAGDVLVVLDARDLEARVREAEEGLRGAAARRDLAQAELRRVEGLFAEKVASRQDLDRRSSEAHVAESEVQAAEQRLADARVARDHSAIRSPVTGRVVDRLAEPGDTAAPGVPLLRIYDPGALRIEAPVRESLGVGLRPGQRLRVDVDAVGRRFEGAIDEIVPYAEPGARTLLVKVRLPADPDLLAGMFGRVEVPAGELDRVVAPRAAIERVGQLEFAEVVAGAGPAERRLVTTGRGVGDADVEVLSGLAPGERVVVPAAAGAAPPPGG
jgi:RND family efflux transporter MFP subunit